MEKEAKTDLQSQPEENLVKKTCRELGITQKELAEMMGVSRQSVSYWATNKIEPPKILAKLLTLLIIEREYKQIRESFKLIDNLN
jgi:DNA-binding transcriptional regulator YiaG